MEFTEKPGYDRKMSREEVNALPLRRFEGEVVLVDRLELLPGAMARLEGEKVLGFDTETRPAFRKGVAYPPALLQLAAREAVFLFRLGHIGLAPPLRALLEDPRVVKAGVAQRDDLKELNQLAPFSPGGMVDLGNAARAAGLMNYGLRGMAAVLLGFRISKGARVSNWARARLLPDQVTYAATDAWVGRLLYQKMVELGLLPP